ncbi:MAG: DUF4112 domain-containing protein [Bradymonadaceae bacterium]
MTADSDANTDLATRGNQELTEQRRRLGHRLRRLDRLADLMDGQFKLPVVRYRIGLDPILGLVPGGGDWVAWVAAAYILWGAARIGAPTHLLVVMAGNVAIDLMGGYVPVLGDVFDAAFKCNRRNVDLLLEHFEFEQPDEGSRSLPRRLPDSSTGRWRLYLLAVALLVGLFLLALAPLALLWWLFA